MLLAVDIGNTNIVFGVHDGVKWQRQWRIQTVHERMPDEYGALFGQFLEMSGLALAGFDQVVLSSVVPPLTSKFQMMLLAQTGVAPLIVNHEVDTGLRFAVKNPAEVGADLIANAVAAYARIQGACIAVDFGTATTFTAVSADAVFLGVAIAPGLNLAASALAGGTAQLPQIRLAAPPSTIGADTISALQAGIVWGYVGLVEGMLDRMSAEMGGNVAAIATGGLSGLMAPLTDHFVDADVGLTLEGIRLIGLRNPMA
ncbi:MAG: type III pantothenate kinase [Anaerolineae bacterium]|nr:type III pantothenate kinase [Anaerolineae bacterium]